MARSWATIQLFTLLLALLANCNITMHMYRIGVLTSLEQRFGFSTSQLGLTLSMLEVGAMPSVLLLSYFCRRSHVPRLLAGAACFIAAAGLLTALPHFIYGSGSDTDQATSTSTSYGGLCVNASSNGTTSNKIQVCGPDTGGIRYPVVFALLILSSICLGVGYGPIGTLGIAFIDKNVPDKKMAPVYIGVINGGLVVGSFTGFLLAAVATRIYVNPAAAWPSLNDSDWLGAWWLGFLIMGALATTTVVPFLLFPRSVTKREDAKQEAETSDLEDELKEISRRNPADSDIKTKGRHGKDMTQTQTKALDNEPDGIPKTSSADEEPTSVLVTKGEDGNTLGVFDNIKRLFTNPVYLGLLVTLALDCYFWAGFITYIPKYLESQFRLDSYVANLLSAVMSGLAAAVGTMLGGIVAARLSSVRPLVCYMLLVAVVSTVGLFGVMFLSCNPSSMATHRSLACNAGCPCSTTDFWPVCGGDGMEYPTPCLAGCNAPPIYGKATNFTSCACPAGGWAASEACTLTCPALYAYAAILFLLSVLCNLNFTPIMALILKVVDEDLKSFALGIMNASLSLLAFLPGPAIFGAIVDTMCIIWQEDQCGSRGSCLAYDVTKFRYALHGLTGVFKSLAILGYIFLFYKVKNMNNLIDERDIALPKSLEPVDAMHSS